MPNKRSKPIGDGPRFTPKAARARRAAVAWAAMVQRARENEARCIRCGCSDLSACPGGCGWLRVDRSAKVGICSNCSRGQSGPAAGRALRRHIREEKGHG
jgi:23S rRNA C2498 (ribose-2'-O)-methylase RlmM